MNGIPIKDATTGRTMAVLPERGIAGTRRTPSNQIAECPVCGHAGRVMEIAGEGLHIANAEIIHRSPAGSSTCNATSPDAIAAVLAELHIKVTEQ